jgi:hypothetical protein
VGDAVSQRDMSRDWRVLKTIAVGVGLLVAYGVGFLCGGLSGEIRTQRRGWAEQRDAVAPILASDPAFSGVRVTTYDDGGWILLEGEVPTEGDKWRLMEAVSQAIGRRRAENAVEDRVQVKAPFPPR